MRKLAVATISFSAAIYAANLILPLNTLMPLALLFLLAGVMVIYKYRSRGAVISLVLFSMAVSFFSYSLYYKNTATKAEKHDGIVTEVYGRVIAYPSYNESYYSFVMEIENTELRGLRAVVYDNYMTAKSLEPGHKIRFTGKLGNANTVFGDSYDSYYAKGIFLKINTKSFIEAESLCFDIRNFSVKLSHSLSEKVKKFFPADTEPFMLSLMLGDKSDFYKNDRLYVSMTRAGFMHIIAVSGMHVAFLVGLIQLMFGRGVSSSIICLVFVWLFVLVTGSSPSAVRAGFMQSLILMAPILRRENDPVTSLSAILAIILLVNPFSAKSISLQLSFSAMAGILLFSERFFNALMKLTESKKLSNRKGKSKLSALAHSFKYYLMASVASSLGVMVFTLPLTAYHFGYFPLLSIFSNIAALWSASLCFCSAWIACILSSVHFLGEYIACFSSWIARYIFLIARLVSSIPYALIYIQTFALYVWFLSSYILIFCTALFNKRKVLYFCLSLLISLASLFTILKAYKNEFRNNDTLTVLDVGQGQCIAAMSGASTIVVDCGNIRSMSNAGDIASAYLLTRGRDVIDILFITHLHEDHISGVLRLIEAVDVRCIILPECDDDTKAAYDDISRSAERNGIELIPLARDIYASCGDISLDIYGFLSTGKDNERCLMLNMSFGNIDTLITADADIEMEKKLVKHKKLDNTNILIVGHHGSKNSSSDELLAELDANIALISVGKNNLYGHPADDTLERLRKHGYTVYRTDEIKTIQIRMGQ